MAMAGSNRWQSGLFDCFADMNVCCVTFWAPCLTYKEIRKALHGGQNPEPIDPALLYFGVCFFTGCQCVLGMMQRQDIRQKYGLAESGCGDCCVHCCCHECALCQEHRELKARPLTAWPPPAPPVGVAQGYPSQQPAATAPQYPKI